MAWVILIVLIVIFLTVIAPLMRQRSVVAARTRKLRGLQRERGTVVITIIHRQEQIGLFGVPLVRFIDIDDSEAVLRAIRLTPNDTPIDLVLHTPGGLVLAADAGPADGHVPAAPRAGASLEPVGTNTVTASGS